MCSSTRPARRWRVLRRASCSVATSGRSSRLRSTPGLNVAAEQAVIARVNAGERIEHQLARRVRKNGTVVEVSVSVFPVCDDAGAVVGSASIARDMTAQHLAEQAHADALALEAHVARDAEARLRLAV